MQVEEKKNHKNGQAVQTGEDESRTEGRTEQPEGQESRTEGRIEQPEGQENRTEGCTEQPEGQENRTEGETAQAEEQENKLAVMPVGKLLLSLSLPAIAAQVVNLLYNMIDRIYIGHIKDVGSLALTGLGVTFPVIILISAFAALIGFGGAPRASIAMGKGEKEKAEEIMGNCVCTLVILAILLTAVFSLWAEPILYAFGASEDTIVYALPYLKIYVLGTLFVQITTGLNAFITSQGFANTAMKTVMIGAGLNLVLDPVFIFGFGMGVQGAALATILSQAVSAIWVIVFLGGRKTTLKIRRRYLRFRPAVMGPVLALGSSPFIMQATESVLSVCFNTSLLRYGGDVAVGAMTILSSVMQIAMMPIQGISQGMQPIISFNYGAHNHGRVRQAFLLGLKVCMIYTFVLWALIMLFPGVFAGIFAADDSLVEYTSWALRVYMASTCIFGAQSACQQTFVALGKAVHSLFLAVLRKIILLIPLIFILPNFFENKVFAVFLAEPVADALAVCTTVTLFFLTAWRKLKEQEN